MATDFVNLTLLLVGFVQQTSPPANFAGTACVHPYSQRQNIPEQINLQELTFFGKQILVRCYFAIQEVSSTAFRQTQSTWTMWISFSSQNQTFAMSFFLTLRFCAHSIQFPCTEIFSVIYCLGSI